MAPKRAKKAPGQRTRAKGHERIVEALREVGLQYPEAHPKSPWPDHFDLAVRNKTFCYLSVLGKPFSISCKLPQSAPMALELPHTVPTGYGLGNSGWVTANFASTDTPDLARLCAWLDESYRAQASKTLVKRLDAGEGPAAPRRAVARPAAKPKVAPRTKKKAAPSKAGAGYSGRPLAKKLGIQAGARVALLNAPPHFSDIVAPLPPDVTIKSTARGRADVVLLFVRERKAFEKRLASLGRMIRPAGALWICWPKKASKVPTDMHEGVVREVALPTGLVDVKVCAVDEVWSGLKLVWRKSKR